MNITPILNNLNDLSIQESHSTNLDAIQADYLYIPGQLGFSAFGESSSSKEEQATIALDKLRRAAKDLGCNLEDVVSINTYHVGDCNNIKDWLLPIIRNTFINNIPVWHACKVKEMAITDALIVVSAIAKPAQQPC